MTEKQKLENMHVTLMNYFSRQKPNINVSTWYSNPYINQKKKKKQITSAHIPSMKANSNNGINGDTITRK